MTTLITIGLSLVLITIITSDRSWNNIQSKQRNDLVFRERFKSYGAYKIRENYSKTLGISLLLTILVIGGGFSSPLLFSKRPEEVVKPPTEKIIEMLSPPVSEKRDIPQPAEIKREEVKSNVSTIKFTEVEVTKDEIVDPILSTDDLKNENISDNSNSGEEEVIRPKDEEVFIEEKIEEPLTFASEMPRYIGGELEMARDIMNNSPYPEMEKENGIEGKVYVQFIVEKDGSISNVKVIRGVVGGPNLSRVAENSIKKLKRFEPARQNGRPVRLTMTVPVSFILK